MADETDGEIVVPPTLHALLAARLDQLEPGERRILECGAIEGEIFHRGALQALAPEETQVTPRLAALVRKELIRPDRPQIAGEDGFRFRHLLIRDAAYEALPKSSRADLHQRLAAWLEAHGTELVELDEILGYHLEQACAYRAELGLPSDDALTLGGKAPPGRRRPASGAPPGLRGGGEPPGARGRARTADRARPRRSKLQLVDVLLLGGQGRRGTPAGRVSRATAPRPQATRLGELCGRIKAADVRTLPRAGGRDSEARMPSSKRRCPIFEAARARPGFVHRVLRACDRWRISRGQADTALRVTRTGRRLRSAGGRAAGVRELGLARGLLPRTARHPCRACCRGSTRTSREQAGIAPRARTAPRRWRCSGASTRRARSSTESRAELAERGAGPLLAGFTAVESAEVELLAGDPAAAAEFGAEGCRLLEELGREGLPLHRGGVSRAGALRARSARRSGGLGRPRSGARRQRRRPPRVCSGARSRRRCSHAAASTQRQSGSHTRPSRSETTTDFLNGQGDAYADLAEVLLLGGKRDDAAAALEQALERYERKENLVSAERTRTRLEELGGTARPTRLAGRLRLLHLRVERREDVPDLLVDDRLQDALPHRARPGRRS